MPAHEIVLEFHLAFVGGDERAHGVVACGNDRCRNAEFARKPHGDRGERHTSGEQARALDVGGEIAVAEPEPGLAAEAAECIHERPRLAGDAPAGLRIGNARQRVNDCVDVWTDMQTEMLEIVAYVDDDSQFLRRQDTGKSVRKLCAADAAGESAKHLSLPATSTQLVPRRP